MKDDCKDSKSQKVSMWLSNDFATFEMFEQGNLKEDVEFYLEMYSPKFKWPLNNVKVLDIGSGDGSVTQVMSKWIPSDAEVTGSDINEKIVQYANLKYGNERMKFIPFDLVGEVPDDMNGQFDHVFSFYTLHWIRDHEKAFTNIYNILPKHGEFFGMFIWCLIFSQKGDPDIHVSNTLKEKGFKEADVSCRQRSCVHDLEVFKGLMTGINCFDIPKDMWSEFLDDIIEVKRYLGLVDEENKTVKTEYNLIVVHCTK